jgi:TonB-dependent Receptor Plug Domain
VAGQWRGCSLGVVAGVAAISIFQHGALAETPPAPDKPAGEATEPHMLPTLTVRAPRRLPRPKRAATDVASSSRVPAEPASVPSAPSSGAPNVGSGPASQPQMASQMRATGEELNARPVARPGEVLEATPGLVVTQHSGEGKANQYFLRGYNLDHGTDMAITVDDMPINLRTHAHGQGYSDLNFLMPETVNAVDIRKGPYFADLGDFGSAGALSIGLIDGIDKKIAQLTVGSFGYERVFGMGSTKTDLGGTLLVAGEAGAYNGPWINPDDMRKINGLMRYSQGTATDGFSVTGMAY